MAYKHSSLNFSNREEADGQSDEKIIAKKQTSVPKKIKTTKEKKSWGLKDTFFLLIATFTFSESAGWMLGYYRPGWSAFLAPIDAICNERFGPIVALFGLAFSFVITYYIFVKRVSWATCNKWMIAQCIFLGITGMTMSMFPNFSMRNTVMAGVGTSSHDFVSYSYGEHQFNLAEHSVSDRWIEPKGNGRISITSSNNNFKLLLPGGYLLSPWHQETWPKENFVFKLVTSHEKQDILMVISKKKEV